MDSNQILTITVFIIVITIVGTIALAVVGYLAFRLRERKHPTRPGLDQTLSKPYFFERVRLPVPEPASGDDGLLTVELGSSEEADELAAWPPQSGPELVTNRD